MDSWLPLVMLLLAGFLAGGVISFVRARRWILVVVLGVGTLMCLAAAILWWSPA